MKRNGLKGLLLIVLLSSLLFGFDTNTNLTKTEISELYVSIFNRASEGEGNQNWQNQHLSMAMTATLMLDTSAAKVYFGSSLDTNQAFIEHIYLNTLNKTPTDDPDGIATWVNQLDSGAMTKGEVVATMIEAINTYAPGGVHYNPNDTKTVGAYNQFNNRVIVSNHMADTIEKAPADYVTSTTFHTSGNEGLTVTSDASTITKAEESVNMMATGSTGNKAPTANAGEDQTIELGDTLNLDASKSSDSDGSIVSYEWKIGTNIFTTSNAQDLFIPVDLVKGNTYTLSLTVTDDDGATGSDSIQITVQSAGNIR